MNQYLEQWVGKELTKELEEGIINAPQDLLGSHIYKEPGVQIFTAYRPCAWNVWLLDGKGEVVGEMEPMELEGLRRKPDALPNMHSALNMARMISLI